MSERDLITRWDNSLAQVLQEEVWDVGQGYGSHSRLIQTFKHVPSFFRDYDGVLKPMQRGNSFHVNACDTCFNKKNFDHRLQRFDINQKIKGLQDDIKQNQREIEYNKKKNADLFNESLDLASEIKKLKMEKKQIGSKVHS